jgi:hypothetical protein
MLPHVTQPTTAACTDVAPRSSTTSEYGAMGYLYTYTFILQRTVLNIEVERWTRKRR